jgi:hypothetical protein
MGGSEEEESSASGSEKQEDEEEEEEGEEEEEEEESDSDSDDSISKTWQERRDTRANPSVFRLPAGGSCHVCHKGGE